MRLLILGGTGMLGHELCRTASKSLDVYATVRGTYEGVPLAQQRVISGVDACQFDTVADAIKTTQPDAVVNCIGIIKQSALAKDATLCFAINAMLPHMLLGICEKLDVRLVHISTDCVFDGSRGGYRETDLPDACDLYGRTKALGEVTEALTLRTSIIGREIVGHRGLAEWFLSNRGAHVSGFPNSKFSGLTTQELSRVIVDLLRSHVGLTGLYHVGGNPIDKHALLHLLNEAFDARVAIGRDESLHIDRTLDSTKFQEATGYVPPTWADMVQDMAIPYSERLHA